MVKPDDMPNPHALQKRIAHEFRELRWSLEQDMDGKRITQQAVAKRLGRSQAYVQEQFSGRRPLSLDVIEATAFESQDSPESVMLALALRIDLDVSGMTDAEALDSLTRGQVSSRAYALAARRRGDSEKDRGVNGDTHGGGETARS